MSKSLSLDEAKLYISGVCVGEQGFVTLSQMSVEDSSTPAAVRLSGCK